MILFSEFPLILYFLFSYLISRGIWILLGLSDNSHQGLLLLAGFGPTLAAVVLTLSKSGVSGLKNLLRLKWRVKGHWYLISLFGTPLVMLTALGLHVALGGARPRYMDPNHLVTSLNQWPLIIVVFSYVFVFTALGEEFGWRGYAQPRLQANITPFTSSIILGISWALWHLPLFWLAGNFHQQLPLSWFLLQIMGSTFLYTWMYNHTRGSLLSAMVFHASSNAAVGLLPILQLDNGGSLRPLWLVVLLLWLLVLLVLWFDRHSFFTKQIFNEKNPNHP